MRLRLGAFQACPWSPPDRLAVYSVSVCSSCVRFFLCCAFRSPIILLWHSVKRSKLCCDVPRYVCESFVLNLGHDSHVVCRLRNQCAETARTLLNPSKDETHRAFLPALLPLANVGGVCLQLVSTFGGFHQRRRTSRDQLSATAHRVPSVQACFCYFLRRCS